jgi:D-alanyl-lipoteichoic acid acyltransferase DltB (MBOAT superfamily)
MRKVMGRMADDAQIESGFRFILGGLMLKLLVGDRLAAFIEIVDRAHGDYRYPILLATVGCYTLQLYADFAGYTNIALGVGKIFGIEGPPNFNAPFVAVNIQEMWRRWHMSLTTWVTDYLFTPLSMSLRSFGETGLVICITLNMVIIGLWHGFTVNFVIFGLLHAVFVTVTVLLKRRFPGNRKAKMTIARNALEERLKSGALALGGMVITFVLMSFSQIFWHSHTWSQAISVIDQVLGLTPSGTRGMVELGPGVAVSTGVCAAIALYDGSGAPGARQVAAMLDRVTPRWFQYGVCLFLLTIFSYEGQAKFVYGQF